MTLDDDKKKVSEQSDQHYYDVSFDIAPDKEDSRGHSTPPSSHHAGIISTKIIPADKHKLDKRTLKVMIKHLLQLTKTS